MESKKFAFWQQWLFWASVSTAVMGLMLVFFDTRWLPFFPEAINQSVWGSSAMPENVVLYHRFAHAVLGATIASWAAVLALVARYPFRAREPWAWWAFVVALAIWFPLDTGMSLFFGVWPNALFNASAVLFLGIPLVFTRSAFRKSTAAA